VRLIAPAERIPEPLFYLPLALNWLRLGLRHGSLSLPTAANPMIEAGGLWGESKTECLDMVSGAARRWIAHYVTLTCEGNGAAERDRAEAAMAAAGLGFPVVVKPDIGWHGVGVRLLRDPPALERYLRRFPLGLRYMLQQPLDWEGEAGVLYVRRPGAAEGRVLSLTVRHHPQVVGDGVSPLRDLILAGERTAWKARLHLGRGTMHAGACVEALAHVPARGEAVRLSFIGSNRVGGLYRDARADVTPALERRFEAISRSMPEFHYGRYDIRFASIERLREGEDFGIIEINGAGGEAIHVWDPEMPAREALRELMRFQSLLFEIGAGNRARGFRPTGLLPLLRCAWRQHRMITRYPPSQ
jgi:hypothetical protein